MDFEKLNRLFDRAVAANWLDRYRTGGMIRLPAKGDVLYTGDIHGSIKNFAAILRRADLDNHPDRHLIIQEVTHQLEMGEDLSYRVLEKTAALKAKYPDRVHVLMGNHELAEVQEREIFKGGLCLNLLFDSALEKVYGPRKDAVRERYMEFIKTLALAAVTETGIFMAHSTPDAAEIHRFDKAFFEATPDPAYFEKGATLEKLVWGRDYAPETADRFAKQTGYDIFLVGHAPCTKGYEVPNHRHIILDCKDRWAAAVLFDLDRRYTHEDLSKMVEFLHPAARAQAQRQVSAPG